MPKKRISSLSFLDSLSAGQIEPFLHKQEWSVHQVISPLLDRIGPAEVSLMTFNFSNDSLHSLFLCDRITRLRMILDFTVQRNKLDLMLFAAEFIPEIRFSSTHAKVMLVHNDSMDFGIVGSANLNLEVRHESGFWFTRGRFFDYFQEKFESVFADSVPYE